MTTFSPMTLWPLWKHAASVGTVRPARSLPRSPVLKVHQGDLAGRGSLNSEGGVVGAGWTFGVPGGPRWCYPSRGQPLTPQHR